MYRYCTVLVLRNRVNSSEEAEPQLELILLSYQHSGSTPTTTRALKSIPSALQVAYIFFCQPVADFGIYTR